MKTLAVIPSRYGSSRFPGKPLADIAGKSMVQRVYEQTIQSTQIDKAIIATDDQRIYDHVRSFGGEVIMTANTHRSGTDRCGEVAALLSEYDIIINVQGDEPFIPTEMIDELLTGFKRSSGQKIATMARLIDVPSVLFSPNVVKVVFNTKEEAIYFSRQAIPYQQGILEMDWINHHDYYKHVGIYVFDRSTLMDLVKLPAGKLEKSESLEQLRWLENGYAIQVVLTQYESFGIDTPEDLSKLKF